MNAGGSVITRGRVLFVDDEGTAAVSIDLDQHYGGDVIKVRPLSANERPDIGSAVYVEVEAPAGLGRIPNWARIVDRPEPMAESTEEKVVPVPEIITQRGAGSYCGECGVPVCRHVASIRPASSQAYDTAYRDGEYVATARLRTLCDQLGIDVPEGKSSLEMIGAEITRLRDGWAVQDPRPAVTTVDQARRELADQVRASVLETSSRLSGHDPAFIADMAATGAALVVVESSAAAPARHVGIDPEMWDSAMSFFSGDRVLAEKSCRRQIAAKKPFAGEVDGWRWWRVEDAPDDGWLAYDNRPMMDQWHDDQTNATRDLEAGRPPRPVADIRPKLVQGRVPWAVVREATRR